MLEDLVLDAGGTRTGEVVHHLHEASGLMSILHARDGCVTTARSSNWGGTVTRGVPHVPTGSGQLGAGCSGTRGREGSDVLSPHGSVFPTMKGH